MFPYPAGARSPRITAYHHRAFLVLHRCRAGQRWVLLGQRISSTLSAWSDLEPSYHRSPRLADSIPTWTSDIRSLSRAIRIGRTVDATDSLPGIVLRKWPFRTTLGLEPFLVVACSGWAGNLLRLQLHTGLLLCLCILALRSVQVVLASPCKISRY